MLFIYITFIFLVLLLLADFKKGVLLYAPLKLFFCINVRFGPGTFDFMMCAVILSLFIFKRRKLLTSKFPLSRGFLLYALLYIITCIIPETVIGFIPRIVLMVVIFSYIYYFCVDSLKNIRFAIVCYALFAIVMCGNGLLGPLLGINPLDDFLQSISEDDESVMFLENTLVRGGQERYRSFIPHAISYGVACCIILYLILWAILVVRRIPKGLMTLSLVFLMSGIMICGSRTPIIGLLPLTYILFSGKLVPRKAKLGFILICSLLLIVKSDYIIYMIMSLVDPKVAAESGGSDASMRLIQYAVALKFFMQSPIWGNGMEFDAHTADSDIYGGESVWLPLLMNNGIIGVAAYAIFLYYIFKLACQSPGKKFLLIISTGWVLMRTATSLIGVTDAQFLTVFFCVYRYYEFRAMKLAESRKQFGE